MMQESFVDFKIEQHYRARGPAAKRWACVPPQWRIIPPKYPQGTGDVRGEILNRLFRFIVPGIGRYYRQKGDDPLSKRTRRQVADEIWLLYFNDYLRERELISEKEHRQMAVKIQTYCASGQGQKAAVE